MMFNEMEIFYYVVELKSFSKAAQRLEVSKSFISKKITKLERDLNIRLLLRSTCTLTLTEAGENFYSYCAKVVSEANKGYAMMSELKGKPAGLLKISIPPALGLNLIAPMIPKYLLRYPEVTLDIELDNRLVDIIEEGYDLALRSAKLESSNLIAQKIFTITNMICATAKYLKKQGTPHKPNELEKHNCATYSYAKEAKRVKLTLKDHEETVFVSGNFTSNHLDLIKKMVLSDLCIGILPAFMIKQEIKDHLLVPLFAEYQIPTSPLYAIYPEREYMLPKLKVFLEMLKHHLK